jgi:hypothetical protein
MRISTRRRCLVFPCPVSGLTDSRRDPATVDDDETPWSALRTGGRAEIDFSRGARADMNFRISRKTR